MKAALPLAALAHQMFLAVSGQGGGADDDSQVIRAYQALNADQSRAYRPARELQSRS
jgi:3-hydroxyisobutyrate dehydrogenase